MKKNRLNILYSWLLLVCFIAGQSMVYTHQHLLVKGITKTAHVNYGHQHQTITEKCYMCDAMHHHNAVIDTPLYVVPQTAIGYVFKACHYNFVSISLVLAAGRAPPAIS
ncbi:hypothetical protein [Mucilaginibacter pineti]|uniref:hypothetical protein n=1 Tax=Mucilaginibacter pineti TaxID=1391627 RepID=UPI00115FA395|nr:hypothetical protein [Mucilaginibacter pineti]